MKLTWGYDQKRHIEDMSLDEQRSLLAWINSKDSFHPSREKEMTKARRILAREIERGEQEDAEERDRERAKAGPRGIVAHLGGGALKVLLALCQVRAQYGRDPVRVTHRQLEQLAGVTEKTVIAAINELLDARLVQEGARSEYTILLDSVKSPEFSPFLSSLFLEQDWIESVQGGNPGLFTASAVERDQVVDDMMTILKQQPLPTVRRVARGHVDRITQVNGLTQAGCTVEDLLLVARWARRMYDTGEERFSPLLNVAYITEPGRFTGYLAAAQSGPARREYHVGGMDEPDDPEVRKWNEQVARQMKEKNLPW